MTLGYDFSTQLRGAAQISPGNVVKPTGTETGGGAWPAASAAARNRPNSQYHRAAEAPVPVSQYSVMLSTMVSIAHGLAVDERAGDLVVAVRVVIEHPGRQPDG